MKQFFTFVLCMGFVLTGLSSGVRGVTNEFANARSVNSFAGASAAAKISNGEQLIAAMRKKYAGKWYKTLTFSQKTVFYRPDGTTQIQTWREAMSIPGKLRIDIEPLDKGTGMIFSDGILHSFNNGKLAGSRPYIHALLVLGFDVYHQPAEKTAAQLKEQKIDLSLLREDTWQGRKVYVVGAKAGDLKSPQFWIDKKELYFVRLLEPTGKDKAQTQEVLFNKYFKVKGGGWVSPEVIVNVDGKPVQTEDYSDVQTDVKLDMNLFDKEKWSAVDKSYFKTK